MLRHAPRSGALVADDLRPRPRDPAAIRVLRDPTRGGVAATVCEIAAVAGVGVELDERAIPVPDEVQAACGFLGLDAIQVANEGRLVAVVAPEAADRVLDAMRATRGRRRRGDHRYGQR